MRYRLLHFGVLIGEVELLRGGHFGDLTLAPGTAWVRDLAARYWAAVRPGAARRDRGEPSPGQAAIADYRAFCAQLELLASDHTAVPFLGLDLVHRPEDRRLGVILESGPVDEGGAPVGAKRPAPPPGSASAVSRPEA